MITQRLAAPSTPTDVCGKASRPCMVGGRVLNSWPRAKLLGHVHSGASACAAGRTQVRAAAARAGRSLAAGDSANGDRAAYLLLAPPGASGRCALPLPPSVSSSVSRWRHAHGGYGAAVHAHRINHQAEAEAEQRAEGVSVYTFRECILTKCGKAYSASAPAFVPVFPVPSLVFCELGCRARRPAHN
eukprot:COSAG01_NODE_4636_length_4847_cov_10.889916_2_plen_187_part_00